MEAFVIVEVAPHKVALPAHEVEQVLRMVALTPIPRAPRHLDGAFDLHGRIVPVVCMRAWLGAAWREPSPDDYLVLVEAPGRLLALHVDRVIDLAIVEPDAIVPTTWSDPELVSSAVRLPTGLAVVPRLDLLAARACHDATP